jgi:hypothetical protein
MGHTPSLILEYSMLCVQSRSPGSDNRTDTERRTTGGSGGDGGRVGDEHEEAKRASWGTPEEVEERRTSTAAGGLGRWC